MGRLIARYLEQRAWRGHVLYPRSAEETRQVAKDHGSSANSCLIAVGGDGTVRQVAAGIIESGGVSSLGVLPSGGGNDFYRMTGMPTVATEALDALRHACPQRCDYGRVAWRQGESVRRMIFMNAAGVGLDAAVAGRAASLRLPGLLRYMVATIVELMRWRPAAAEIRFDSEPASRHMRLLFAYAANGKYGGGGFKLAPRASARDGMLDVCLVGNLSLSRALVLFPRAIQGTHEYAPEVRIVRAALVELLPNTPMPLHVDGDLLTNRASQIRIEIIPRGISVLMASSGTAARPPPARNR